MGYRSDVGIALGFKTKGDCDKFIMAYKLAEPKFWREVIVGSWDRVDVHVLVGRYEAVKWHRGFEDVDAVHEMLEWAVENCHAAYRFARIGEDYDDVEVEEDWDDEGNSLMLEDYVDLQRAVNTATGTPIG